MLAHRQSKVEIKDILKAVSIFRSLKPDVLDSLSEHAFQRIEKKGSILFSPDMPNDKFYIIISGWVKLFRETMDGTEAVIDVLTASHSFGEIGLPGAGAMPYGAEVIEDANIVCIPRFLLTEEVMRNGLFGLQVLQSMAHQKMKADLEIEHRTVQTAPQRIGCFLLKLCRGAENGSITVHLPYDKTVVAARLGMQPETFSRALSKLREEVGLKINGASVEVKDIQELVRYTCSTCSSSFPCKEAEF